MKIALRCSDPGGGFVCKRFLPSPSPPPLPSFIFSLSFQFLAWPKPKMLFLGLSLFGNQTETLATQARTAAANTAAKRIAHEHKI